MHGESAHATLPNTIQRAPHVHRRNCCTRSKTGDACGGTGKRETGMGHGTSPEKRESGKAGLRGGRERKSCGEKQRAQVARSGSVFSTSGLGISRLSTIGSPRSSPATGEGASASHDEEGGCSGDGEGGEMDLAGCGDGPGGRTSPPRPGPSLQGSLSDSWQERQTKKTLVTRATKLSRKFPPTRRA